VVAEWGFCHLGKFTAKFKDYQLIVLFQLSFAFYFLCDLSGFAVATKNFVKKQNLASLQRRKGFKWARCFIHPVR